jgi:predicted transcriptional regulator
VKIMREVTSQIAREDARESFKQEAMAAWTAYGETGRHLTAEETRAWLKTWGTEAETELPGRHE